MGTTRAGSRPEGRGGGKGGRGEKEGGDGYYKAVLKARGQAAAQALVDAVNRERNDDDHPDA